jgi:hypothetical protein
VVDFLIKKIISASHDMLPAPWEMIPIGPLMIPEC